MDSDNILIPHMRHTTVQENGGKEDNTIYRGNIFGGKKTKGSPEKAGIPQF